MPTIITHSGRNQDSRSISLTEVPTSSNPTGRLLSAQAEDDVVNPAIAVRRDIRARWKCTQLDCESQTQPEPACYSKDARRLYPITAQDLASWAAAILEDRSGRLTVDTPPPSLFIVWEREWKNQQKNATRKKKNKGWEDDRDRAPYTTAPGTTIIQLQQRHQRTLLAAFQGIDPLALKPSSFHVAIWTLIAQSVAHTVVVGPLPQSLIVRELLLQNKDSVQDMWQIILSGH